MRRYLLLGVSIWLAGCGTPAPELAATVTINQHQFTTYVADTTAERRAGLGPIAQLGDREGMLFIFPSRQAQTFWMQGVEYPIDIIWIADQRVIGSVTAYPGTDTLYDSPGPIEQVLEVPAGTVETGQIRVGDNVVVDEY